MAITSLARNFNGDPNIVTMITDSSLATITTAGFLTLPTTVADINTLNKGVFQFASTDMWLIAYSGGIAFFTRDASTNAFVASGGGGGLSDALDDGDIFVGNASNIATGVTPSGDITLSNTGVFGIAAGVIVNADVNASAAIAFSKLAALTSTNILVGSAGNVATAVAMSGDGTLSNTGALTIANDAVTLDKLAPGVKPSHIIFQAAAYMTTGGSTQEDIPVPGGQFSDIPLVSMIDPSLLNSVLVQAFMSGPDGQVLSVIFESDPGNETIIAYQILRQAV